MTGHTELKPLTDFPGATYLFDVMGAVFKGHDVNTCVNVSLALVVHGVLAQGHDDATNRDIIEGLADTLRANLESQSAARRLRDAAERALGAVN
jgi:hypothetical protein